MGANPNHKDIFLEIDWVNNDSNSDCGQAELNPNPEGIQDLIKAFAEAPISNRDGINGLTLHVDYGQGNGFTGGNLIDGSDSYLNGELEGEFSSHKVDNFASNRQGYFHYAIQANAHGDSGSGGLAYLPGFDLIITQGCPSRKDAYTFMHELGHNLGLRHGGDENCNYKPNYNSVMNYLYQAGTFVECDRKFQTELTYSPGSNTQLNENALDENTGICDNAKIDWNADGNYSTIAHNINSQEAHQEANCGGTLTLLNDFDDWANIHLLGPSDHQSWVINREVIVD